MGMIYEVQDLHEMNKLDDEGAVKSAISLATALIAQDELMISFLIGQMRIVFDDIPAPAGVSVDDDIYLHINTHRWDRVKTNQDLVSLLTHEALHITQNHLYRFRNQPGYMANIAEDLAINQFSELQGAELIKTGVNLDTINMFAEAIGTLQHHESADYYLAHLKERPKTQSESGSANNGTNTPEKGKNGSNGQNFGSGDGSGEEQLELPNHDVWQTSTGDVEKISDTVARVVGEAVSRSKKSQKGSAGRGLISQELMKKIEARGKKYNLPTLQKAMATMTQKVANPAYKRTYARYAAPRSVGVLRKGRKKIETPLKEILAFVDTSGSISEQMIADTLASVEHANAKKKTPIKFKTIYFDTKVYVDSKRLSKNVVKGRGGTAFQPVFDYLKAIKVPLDTDFVIITDGQGERHIADYGYNPTWMLSKKDQYTDIPDKHKKIWIEN